MNQESMVNQFVGYGVTLHPTTRLLMNSAATTALALPMSFGLQNANENRTKQSCI